MKLAALGLMMAFFADEPSGCGTSVGANKANAADGGTTSVEAPCTAATHTFCEGFSNDSLPSGFDAEDVFAGELAFDRERSVSAPAALIATTTKVTTGTRTMARLKKDFTGTGQRFTLAYSEWVDSSCIGQGDSVETGVIGLRGNSYWVAIRHGRDNDAILESGVAANSLVQSHVLPNKLRRDGWVRVLLEVDLGKQTVELSLDGTKIIAAEPLKSAPAAPQSPHIALGILNDNLQAPPTACKVSIDDVAFNIVQ